MTIEVHLLNLQKKNALTSLLDKPLEETTDGRVEKCIHLAISPRNMFKRTVSAISSALCPVASLSTFSKAAPRSRALEIKPVSSIQSFHVTEYLCACSFEGGHVQHLTTENATKCAIILQTNHLHNFIHCPSIQILV